jgi:hypothetical protein
MNDPVPFNELEFVRLNAAHDLSGFYSTEPELDDFLKGLFSQFGIIGPIKNLIGTIRSK